MIVFIIDAAGSFIYLSVLFKKESELFAPPNSKDFGTT